MSRAQHILTEALVQLKRADGETMDVAVLNALVNRRIQPDVGFAELKDQLVIAEENGWVKRVVTVREGTLWAITNKGRAEV